MEYKYDVTDNCKDRIADLMVAFEDDEFDDVSNIEDPNLRLAYQYMIEKRMFDAIMENDVDKMEIAIRRMSSFENKQSTYDIFVYFLQNYYMEFINFLTTKIDSSLRDYDLIDGCELMLEYEYPQLYEDEIEREKFYSQFNTVEDMIRLFPAIYNILLDAFDSIAPEQNRNIIHSVSELSEYPNDLIDMITQKQLKYKKSNLDDWHYVHY